MTGRVLVVGDVVTDIMVVHEEPVAVGSDTVGRITPTGGGAGANTAAWLAAAGVPVDLIAVVGTDPAGATRLAELASSGVGCAAVRRTDAAATGTIVVLARGDERSMITDRAANLQLSPADIDSALGRWPDAAHLHLSGYPLLDTASRPAGQHALHVARARGLTTSVDAASAAPLRRVGGAAFRDWVRGTDLLLANYAEALALLDLAPAGLDPDPVVPDPAEAARLLTTTAGNVVVKLGPAGAVWATAEGDVVRADADPTQSVEVTGAGDAFAAGLLGGWLDGADLRQALSAGTRLGALAVRRIGGRPGRASPGDLARIT